MGGGLACLLLSLPCSIADASPRAVEVDSSAVWLPSDVEVVLEDVKEVEAEAVCLGAGLSRPVRSRGEARMCASSSSLPIKLRSTISHFPLAPQAISSNFAHILCLFSRSDSSCQLLSFATSRGRY